MRKVVIPRAADVFSAWGMLMSDLRRDAFLTRLLPLRPRRTPAISRPWSQRSPTRRWRSSTRSASRATRVRFERFGKLRYENQEHTVEIRLPDGPLDAAAVDATSAAFHEAYEREYTYRLAAPIEFVGLHLVSYAAVGKLEPLPLPVTGRAVGEAVKGHRDVDYALEGVHRRDDRRRRPARAGDDASTGRRSSRRRARPSSCTRSTSVSVDRFGNLHIDRWVRMSES